MSAIGDYITERLKMRSSLGACDTRMVADLVALEIRRGCRVQQETGEAATFLQRLRSVLRRMPLFTTPLAIFAECVEDAMQAVATSIVTLSLDTQQITTGAILGVLRAAREYNLSEHVAISEASRALIDQTDKAGGNLTETARGIAEGAIENARALHRPVPSATSAAIWAVADSLSECDSDTLESVARGIARFVHVQSDHFVVETTFPVAA